MYGKRRLFLVCVVVLTMLLSTGILGQAAELWHYWLSGGEKDALNALMAAAREACPDATFTERGIPGAAAEMTRQLGSSFMGNDPPEIFQSGIGWALKQWVEADRLMNLDEIWKNVNGDKVFAKGLKSSITFDGHVYAIPLNMHVASHIFYNKHIFDKYNLTPPKTWNEYKKLSSFLRSKGIEPLAAQSGAFIGYQYYPAMVAELGPEKCLALVNGELAFTDPKIKASFKLYRDTMVASYMKGWSGYGWAEAANQVLQGKAAMYLMGDWLVALFEQRGWKYGVDYDFFPAPGMQKVIITQTDCLAAPKGAKDWAGAQKFLTAAAGVKVQSAFNKYKGSVAANLTVPSDVYGPAIAKTHARITQVVDAGGVVMPNPSVMLPPKIKTEWLKQIERYALSPDDATLDSALKILEDLRQEALRDKMFVKWATWTDR